MLKAARLERSSRCLMACLAMMLPGLLAADEGTGLGQWVRVTTAAEGTGEGFGLSAGQAKGKSLSQDKQTTTFEVNGHPVRVAKPGTTTEGEVQASDQETLTLARAGQNLPIVVPRAAISRLEVRRRESRKGKGFLFGLLGGGAIGYAIGAATSGPGCRGGETGLAHLCTLDDLNKPLGGLLGAVTGALLGVVVAPGAKWEHVPSGHAQLSVGPTLRRGIGLAVAVTF